MSSLSFRVARPVVPLLASALLAGCGGGPRAEQTAAQESPTVQSSDTEAPSNTALPDFDGQWNYGDPAATEARFREILADVGPKAPLSYRLQLQTQIARCQGLQADFAAAHATLDAVEAALPQAPPVVEVRYLLERGRVFNSSKAKERARPLFVTAFEKGKAAQEDAYAVDAAHMVAIAESGEAALAWNLKALDLAGQSPDPAARKWAGALYNNIGWLHFDAGNHAGALAAFEKGLAARQQAGKPGPIRIAKWSIGRTLRAMDRNEQALEVMLALDAELRAAGEEDGFVYEELGELYLKRGEAEAAKGWFTKAHPLLARIGWVAQGEPARLARIAELAGLAER